MTSDVVDTASLDTHAFGLADAPEAFETQLRADESVTAVLRM
ncbi:MULTISPECIES: hypothetical protein [unclassified Actinopolyspora]|nr:MULTISPECIES: hypothetical protein [unclassified Actinopolyspora]